MMFRSTSSPNDNALIKSKKPTPKIISLMGATPLKDVLVKEGWVFKKSAYMKTYRKRFMRLKGDLLYCYKTSAWYKEEPTEIFNLAIHPYKIEKNDKVKEKFYLVDTTLHTKRTFKAMNYEECNDWINKLNSTMFNGKQLRNGTFRQKSNYYRQSVVVTPLIATPESYRFNKKRSLQPANIKHLTNIANDLITDLDSDADDEEDTDTDSDYDEEEEKLNDFQDILTKKNINNASLSASLIKSQPTLSISRKSSRRSSRSPSLISRASFQNFRIRSLTVDNKALFRMDTDIMDNSDLNMHGIVEEEEEDSIEIDEKLMNAATLPSDQDDDDDDDKKDIDVDVQIVNIPSKIKNMDMDNVDDDDKKQDISVKRKYTVDEMDIIEQLKLFNYSQNEIVDAMDKLDGNRNINDIMEFMEKKQLKRQNSFIYDNIDQITAKCAKDKVAANNINKITNTMDDNMDDNIPNLTKSYQSIDAYVDTDPAPDTNKMQSIDLPAMNSLSMMSTPPPPAPLPQLNKLPSKIPNITNNNSSNIFAAIPKPMNNSGLSPMSSSALSPMTKAQSTPNPIKTSIIKSPKELKRLKKRLFIEREIVSTETTYFKGLKCLLNELIEPIFTNNYISRDLYYDRIRSSLPEILSFHATFLDKLVLALNNSKSIGLVFNAEIVQKKDIFIEMYIKFIVEYNDILDLFGSTFHSNKLLQLHLKDRRREQKPLSNFLILPVQRVPRYILLLHDLKKNTLINELDYNDINNALNMITSITHEINERKRKIENLSQCLQIQESLNGLKIPIVDKNINRTYHDQFIFIKKEIGHQRLFFVFNDIIIIANNKWKVKQICDIRTLSIKYNKFNKKKELIEFTLLSTNSNKLIVYISKTIDDIKKFDQIVSQRRISVWDKDLKDLDVTGSLNKKLKYQQTSGEYDFHLKHITKL